MHRLLKKSPGSIPQNRIVLLIDSVSGKPIPDARVTDTTNKTWSTGSNAILILDHKTFLQGDLYFSHDKYHPVAWPIYPQTGKWVSHLVIQLTPLVYEPPDLDE